ncbi:STAS domain-containing protein [Paraferrimonas sedimenticola]|uniref:STAS domain-containing protein n=1 Tax=Paraferrimonas sedimenticola TaxID=375674 RepID=A0AA37RV68_9GAMM|nr:STAS domain-containing protein [Paraferrimonas sedimenticola]GLP95820.1 hypothetical protein GCM10007895_11260 [Paraferrimonas sedimenticola]
MLSLLKEEPNRLALSGRLDMPQVAKIAQTDDYHLAKEVNCVDLSQLTYIDSAGVALLLRWSQLASQQNQRQLQFLDAPKAALELAQLYQLTLFEAAPESA